MSGGQYLALAVLGAVAVLAAALMRASAMREQATLEAHRRLLAELERRGNAPMRHPSAQSDIDMSEFERQLRGDDR